MFRRHFTIMVVPDAQALLRRFHIRGGQIAGGLIGLTILASLALSAPLFLLWGLHEMRELAAVRADRDHLVARSHEIDQTIAEMRQKLADAEQKVHRLAVVAGMEVTPPREAKGAGSIVDPEKMTPEIRADQLKSEAEDLIDRTTLLDRKIGSVGLAIGRQGEKFAHYPLLSPTRGLLGAGFGWRRDPFTGLRQFHRGLDICAPAGSAVRAPADGVVLRTERDGGYGNVVTLSHGDGIVTRYGHLSAFKVHAGDRVRRGDVIALVGNTGRSTGAHVHYEVLERGLTLDPQKYLMDDEWI